MAEVGNVQTNFSSGELDPLVRGRADSAAYQNGVANGTNCILFSTGGAARRPGTSWLADLSNFYTRIIPFEYSDDDQYIVGIQAGLVRVFKTDGTQLGVFGTPWAGYVEIKELAYSQLGDAMVFTSQTTMPYVLARTSATTFTFTIFAFEASADNFKIAQPYEKFQDRRLVTLTPSSNAGSIDLYASAAGTFAPGHVGTRIKIYDIECLVTSYVNSAHVTATTLGVLEGKLQTNALRVIQFSNTVEVTHVGHGLSEGALVLITGATDILTLSYNGTGTVTSSNIGSDQLNGVKTIHVIDQDRYSYTVTLGTGNTGSYMYQTVDGGGAGIKWEVTNHPVSQWREQVFSPVRGYPHTVCFHEQRLWFGGTQSKPDGLWSSQIARYYNFDVGDGNDNESIQASIGSDLGSVVLHLVSNRHLQIYTTTSELYCPPPTNSTLTPSSFRVAPQTRYGASKLRPQVLDGATIYLQANGKTIRENIYTDTEQAYNASSVSLLAGHMIDSPIDMAVLRGSSQRGEQMACFVNTNGTCAVFFSSRSEKMAGWTPWRTNNPDYFVSVCAVGSSFFFVVFRNGKYYLERLQSDDDLTLDGSQTFSDPIEKSAWSVGTRYAGRTVDVCSGSLYYMGRFAVDANGVLDLGELLATSITVGYGFDFLLKTLPPAIETAKGKRIGKVQRIAEAIILFNQTVSATIQGQRLILRRAADSIEAAAEPVTEARRFYFRGYSREPSIEIVQGEPLAIRILYIHAKVVA